MEKKNYIQPEMKVVGLSSQDSLMQMALSSSSAPQPAPQRRLLEEPY